jgi:hypothetical protein
MFKDMTFRQSRSTKWRQSKRIDTAAHLGYLRNFTLVDIEYIFSPKGVQLFQPETGSNVSMQS